MSDCRAAATPVVKESSEEGKATQDDSTEVKFPYRQAVGSLIYLMVMTRPDIAFAVGNVARHLEKPTHEDVIRVKRIFRYLKGTVDHGIVYKKGYKPGELECWSDADHGGDQDTGRSTTGVVCIYSGGAVSWQSQRQVSVAISTTEAELVAASEAGREVVWLKRLMKDVVGNLMTPVIRVDNEAAIKIAHNPEYHKRTKHIKIRHFYIRELVTEGELKIMKVSTEDQLADLFTKPLTKERVQVLTRKIGIVT